LRRHTHSLCLDQTHLSPPSTTHPLVLCHGVNVVKRAFGCEAAPVRMRKDLASVALAREHLPRHLAKSIPFLPLLRVNTVLLLTSAYQPHSIVPPFQMPAPFRQMQTWQATAKQMQDHRDGTIAAIEPKLPALLAEMPLNVTSIPKMMLTEREIELTESPPEVLITLLAGGCSTSMEVTNAFLRRAALAQKLVLPYLSISHRNDTKSSL
jgi:hypothetical protein